MLHWKCHLSRIRQTTGTGYSASVSCSKPTEGFDEITETLLRVHGARFAVSPTKAVTNSFPRFHKLQLPFHRIKISLDALFSRLSE